MWQPSIDSTTAHYPLVHQTQDVSVTPVSATKQAHFIPPTHKVSTKNTTKVTSSSLCKKPEGDGWPSLSRRILTWGAPSFSPAFGERVGTVGRVFTPSPRDSCVAG